MQDSRSSSSFGSSFDWTKGETLLKGVDAAIKVFPCTQTTGGVGFLVDWSESCEGQLYFELKLE